MKHLTQIDFRLLRLWGVLIIITLISLESIHLKGHVIDERVQAAIVIILAFVKVRLIILDFMEVRGAPRPLRFALEGWVVVMSIALMAMVFYPFQ